MAGGERRDGGFTLIEVLVALAVAMAVLLPLYELLSVGLRSGSMAQEDARALQLAESALEAFAAGMGLEPGETSEMLDGGYERRTLVRARMDLLREKDAPAAIIPYEVEVSIAWRSGARQRSLMLATIALGARP